MRPFSILTTALVSVGATFGGTLVSACFYNEKVDLYIDERQQDRPHSPFS